VAKEQKEISQEEHDLLSQRAFELFTTRSVRGGSSPALVKQCFRDAATFLAISDNILVGDDTAEVPTGPQLADACAPNLPCGGVSGMHPLNLVSSRFGDLKKCRLAHDWLKSNPANDQDPKAYEALGWDVPTTNLARIILAPYANAS